MRGGGGRAAIWLVVPVAAAVFAACGPVPKRAAVFSAVGRYISAIRILPPSINLHDHMVGTLAVVEFGGEHGKAVAARLASDLERDGAFRVVAVRDMADRLMRAGLSVEWDASPTILPWVGERTGVDAVIVGRVEHLEQEGVEKEQETLALVETGEYVYVLNEQEKLSLQERLDYQTVPLFCRVDRGSITVSYRVWHTRFGELVAQRSFTKRRQMPSYCYRGTLAEDLRRNAEDRLRHHLIGDVTSRFLQDILPDKERTTVLLEGLPRGAGALQVQRNELAMVYASRGDWDLAEELWQECLRERSDLAAVHYNLAMVYETTARLSLAEEHLRSALGVDAKPLYQDALRRVRAAADPDAPPEPE